MQLALLALLGASPKGTSGKQGLVIGTDEENKAEEEGAASGRPEERNAEAPYYKAANRGQPAPHGGGRKAAGQLWALRALQR